MEIFVRDAETESGKWRSVLVNVSVCLPTSHPTLERHFLFRALGRGFRMYEDTNWHNVISKLKQIWVDIRHYILIPYVESTDEISRLI